MLLVFALSNDIKYPSPRRSVDPALWHTGSDHRAG